MSPGKLAKLDRRAAELGQGRSDYVRYVIDQDLQASRQPGKHVFASADLVGCIATGIEAGDNETVRRIARKRLLAREHEKNR